jgi:dihydroorotase
MLWSKSNRKENLVVRGARVVDPGEGIDAVMDVRVDCGIVAQVGADLDTNEHHVIAGQGLVLAPAFVDPHVHLRTPGREDEETIASGTQAAAAGGFCAVLAMPNTDPVVDSAAVLGALVEAAKAQAEVPVGFLAAITKGQAGAELAELGELADAGAAAFTDDGSPVGSPGLMRRALQYGAVARRPLAVHCEERTLSRGGQMHEGAVSAELGFSGYPSVAESLMVERDLALAAYETAHLERLGYDLGRVDRSFQTDARAEPARPDGRRRQVGSLHLLHLSARESVAALSRAQAAGLAASGEVTPHHLCLTDEAVRSLDANFKMNPPLRSENDRQTLLAALRDGTISAIATDHAPHARHEKEVPFEEAPFGVTGLETAFAALYTELVEPGLVSLETLLQRMSAGPARVYGLDEPRIAVGAPANLVLLDLGATWHVTEGGFRSRSANSWLLGRRLKGQVRTTIAAGRLVYAA